MSSRYRLNRRAFLRRATAVATGCIAPAVFTRAAWAQERADIIFSGGTIITMDAAAPRAEALAVSGGRWANHGGGCNA